MPPIFSTDVHRLPLMIKNKVKGEERERKEFIRGCFFWEHRPSISSGTAGVFLSTCWTETFSHQHQSALITAGKPSSQKLSGCGLNNYNSIIYQHKVSSVYSFKKCSALNYSCSLTLLFISDVLLCMKAQIWEMLKMIKRKQLKRTTSQSPGGFFELVAAERIGWARCGEDERQSNL